MINRRRGRTDLRSCAIVAGALALCVCAAAGIVAIAARYPAAAAVIALTFAAGVAAALSERNG